jgi:hypothetical protein
MIVVQAWRAERGETSRSSRSAPLTATMNSRSIWGGCEPHQRRWKNALPILAAGGMADSFAAAKAAALHTAEAELRSSS